MNWRRLAAVYKGKEATMSLYALGRPSMACPLNIFHVSEAVTELCSSCYYCLNLDILMYKQKYLFFVQDVFALIYSITEHGITFILI
jgi:hypothetical protein